MCYSDSVIIRTLENLHSISQIGSRVFQHAVRVNINTRRDRIR